jgi:diguanylate cyclase (GGDEF)-like protein
VNPNRVELLESIFHSVGDPVMAISLDHRLLWMNDAAQEMLEAGPNWAGQHCYEVCFNRCEPCPPTEAVPCSLFLVSERGCKTKFTMIRNSRNEGGDRKIEVIAMPLRDASGELVGVVKSMRDITEHQQRMDVMQEKEQMLIALSRRDPLTGLANRDLAIERIEYAIRQAHRSRNLVGLLFVDLNGFKQINDSHGHDVGDVILRESGSRFTCAVREGDTVARLGGDEFVVVLDRLDAPEDAAVVARKLLAALHKPMCIDLPRRLDLAVSASIGISIYPRDGVDADTLLRNADTAMYAVKRNDSPNPHFFSEELTRLDKESRDIEFGLRRALGDVDNNEFFLLYQPVVNLVDGRIEKVEALLRWSHPELGVCKPGRFLPVAMESGLIKALDEWVLMTACAQYLDWRSKGFDIPRISVNLSAKPIYQRDFPSRLAAILDSLDCPAHALEIELNEACVMSAPEMAQDILQRLREMGVTITIDDFGTGYTSLNQLQRMPITHLKLDCALVSRLPEGQNEAAVTRAILALGASMQFKVVAEGIENAAQRDFLIAEGCEQGQGHYFSEPVSPEQLVHLFG